MRERSLARQLTSTSMLNSGSVAGRQTLQKAVVAISETERGQHVSQRVADEVGRHELHHCKAPARDQQHRPQRAHGRARPP